jgi:hypothetical protein
MARRALAALAIACLATIGFTAYAYTASNTVPATTAGDGSGTVSGFTATNVSYGLNATTPTNIDSVTFTIAPVTTTTVKAKLAGNWYACTNTAGSVSCNTTSPQLTVAPVTTLEVLAVG